MDALTSAELATSFRCRGTECVNYEADDPGVAEAACAGIAKLIARHRTDYITSDSRPCPWQVLRENRELIDLIAPDDIEEVR